MNIQEIKEILPESNQMISITLIQKGWSSDFKFKLIDKFNQSILLRVSTIKEYDLKKYEYEVLNHPSLNDVNIIKPYKLGVTLDKLYCYTLSEWIEGQDLEEIIHEYPIDIQYRLGYEAGQILRKIHSIKIETDRIWDITYQHKIERKIENALQCPLQLNKIDKYINYINLNRHLIKNRPVSFQHGDFHIGNTLVNPNDNCVLIDFNRHDIGDPWEEFNRIPFSAQVSTAYASGNINGYFKDEIPDSFFPLLALYISVNQVSSLPWAIQFGESEINFSKTMSDQILTWYSDFNTIIPNWYISKK